MIVIAFGANLESEVGPPAKTISAAMAALSINCVRTVVRSPYYLTPAWPDASDPPFVNAVAQIETELSPDLLMARLHQIESAFGRTRNAKNAPRTLDLDLIDYDAKVEIGPPVLPHPRMAERAFVLIPLADIAPNWRHPVSGLSVGELIAALPPDVRAAIRPVCV
jgi:2-amino-4-hydroxy-6-hydroxymethyldihydropteridine diphosphokinase